MVIGPGRVNLSFRVRVGARQPRFARVHARAQPQFADDGRAHRLVAIVANAHFDAPFEVDAVDRFEKAVDEMLARLLAVADDIDAGVFLKLERQQSRVVFGVGEFIAFETPRRPELVRLREPCRFWQTAGDGGREERRRAACCHGAPGRAFVLSMAKAAGSWVGGQFTRRDRSRA